jgi:radical SAM superfamily enzyme YgiQ (UPF0313 family)
VKVLLLSTYELGHQPLAVARPAAHLAAAGHAVRCQDLAVEHLDEDAVREAEVVGISMPMHTAARLGVRLAERVRRINPGAHLCAYGLYAGLHADLLVGRVVDSVIGGEFEQPLVDHIDELGRAPLGRPTIEGVRTAASDGGLFLGRQRFGLPRREPLPSLDCYARVVVGEQEKLVGYVEASRGCAHRCLHCPITPVYRGRLRIVEEEVVLDDVHQLVAMGAEHITFGDPDFFNGIRHSLRIVERMHDEFPALTYDATIKVEHLIEHRQHLPTLRATGCLFVVSAFESVHDHILSHLAKGHGAVDLDLALGLAEQAGIVIRPTFVAFTPWTSLSNYLELARFVVSRGLTRHVEPIQLAIRLLVPRGSSLVGTPALEPFLEDFESESFSYRWRHPDPRVDELQREVAGVVERAARTGQWPEETFAQIHELACQRAGEAAFPLDRVRPATASPVPRLTEPWFC